MIGLLPPFIVYKRVHHVQVLVVIFGQELPEATASLASQVFGLCVALVGLATFALVLALLQQVMDVLTLAIQTLHCRKIWLTLRFGRTMSQCSLFSLFSYSHVLIDW